MVQTCGIISEYFCSTMTNEKGTVVMNKAFNLVANSSCFHCKLKMFRGLFVCKFCGFFKGRTNNDSSVVVDALACNLCSLKSFQLLFNFFRNTLCKVFISKGKDRLSNNVVFCLGKQVCGNPFRICTFICNDENFCWTCNHINAYSSINKLLCFSNEFVSRTYDYIYCRN